MRTLLLFATDILSAKEILKGRDNLLEWGFLECAAHTNKVNLRILQKAPSTTNSLFTAFFVVLRYQFIQLGGFVDKQGCVFY